MTWDQLRQVGLWPSHILIRYQPVASSNMSFWLPMWPNPEPLPVRDKNAARTLAYSIAKDLRADPSLFDSYARQYSEDSSTRDNGGSLGNIRATHLRPFPEVLDALAAIQPGEVSQVIETKFGFHILKRGSRPQAEKISGARLIVGYAEAPLLRTITRKQLPQRSRAEAAALAEALAEQAQRSPEVFSKLVQQYSEYTDRYFGGDLGVWAWDMPSDNFPEIQILQKLPIGGVSGAVDSIFGYEVLQRSALRPRKQYAMSALHLHFKPKSSDDLSYSRARAATLRKATELLVWAKEDPHSFELMQQEYCCMQIYRFEEGHAYPEVAEAFSKTPFGEFALVELADRFIIAKNIDPSTLPPLEQKYIDLNDTPPFDPYYWLSMWDPKIAREHLRYVLDKTSDFVNATETKAKRFMTLHTEPWPRSLDRGLIEYRYQALKDGEAELRDLLGKNFSRYRQILDLRVEDAILHPA